MGEEVKGKYVTCGTGDSQALVGRGKLTLKGRGRKRLHGVRFLVALLAGGGSNAPGAALAALRGG